MTQMHAIISFDINQLPQAAHNYQGSGVGGGSQPALITNIPRAKVPVRDGHSQGVSCKRKFLFYSQLCFLVCL